jgi:hypothetical protein
LKILNEDTHEEAQANIVQAQEKQVKTQNIQTNASHNILKKGEKVTKDCRLIKNKWEPNFKGPFKIIDRNARSGNYTLENEQGEQHPKSFPR